MKKKNIEIVFGIFIMAVSLITIYSFGRSIVEYIDAKHEQERLLKAAEEAIEK